MPRCARLKSCGATYHVMVKSISEVDLFSSEEDKLKYIDIVKDYQKLYKFTVSGFCLMDNHGHFVINANGADISRIMHGINFKYARYYNKKHNRHGHLFQDRFKSKIVDDERYLYALIAYVHYNPTAIPDYADCPQEYKFSSMGIYMGLRKDNFNMIDMSFVYKFLGNNPIETRKKHVDDVGKCKELIKKLDGEFKGEKSEYRSGVAPLIRNVDPEEVINYVAQTMDVTRARTLTKNTRGSIEAKAMLVFLMRCICNLRCIDICKIFGIMTESRVSKLCRIGLELYDKDVMFRNKVENFISLYANEK